MYFEFSFHIIISKSDCDVTFVQLTTYSLIKKISLSKEFSIRTDIESADNPTRDLDLNNTGTSRACICLIFTLRY